MFTRCFLRLDIERFLRRLVNQPAEELLDIAPICGAWRGQGEISARRIVTLRQRCDEPAVAQMLGEHGDASKRDALTRDGGLDHLIVQAEAIRPGGLEARLAVRRKPAPPVEPRRAPLGTVE